MKSKTISQTQTVQEQELLELPISAEELEEILTRLGADIDHPLRVDPVAKINNKLVAFWTQ